MVDLFLEMPIYLCVTHNGLFVKYKTMKTGGASGKNAQSALSEKLLHAIVDCALLVLILEKKSFGLKFETG